MYCFIFAHWEGADLSLLRTVGFCNFVCLHVFITVVGPDHMYNWTSGSVMWRLTPSTVQSNFFPPSSFPSYYSSQCLILRWYFVTT